jgi:hypothetical protein
MVISEKSIDYIYQEIKKYFQYDISTRHYFRFIILIILLFLQQISIKWGVHLDLCKIMVF